MLAPPLIVMVLPMNAPLKLAAPDMLKLAAGALIAAEAGARVLLPAPSGAVGGAGLVVAAAPGIADELVAALKRCNGLEPIPD